MYVKYFTYETQTCNRCYLWKLLASTRHWLKHQHYHQYTLLFQSHLNWYQITPEHVSWLTISDDIGRLSGESSIYIPFSTWAGRVWWVKNWRQDRYYWIGIVLCEIKSLLLFYPESTSKMQKVRAAV